ncbi:MAG: PD-(D/E)XK nuclease domain-containing protein, partial [Bacteroidota bacterium]
YHVESECESGSGRADVILIPKSRANKQALVIEYKVGKHTKKLSTIAKKGLAQIIAKDYVAKVQAHEHVERILAVCLAFCGKHVALESTIITSER